MHKAKPVKPELLTRAAEALAAGNPAQAERLYRAVLAAQPDYPAALHALSVLAYQRGSHRQALWMNERLLARYPSLPEAHFSRGTILQAMGRYEEALASFGSVVALEPRYADAHFGRAYALFERGRPDEALEAYDRVLALAPDHALACNNRGNTLRALRRYPEALASLDRAVELEPRYAEAFTNRANVLKDMERFEDAIESYDRGLAIRADQPDAWNNRGLALQRMTRFDEALRSFDQAIELAPKHAEHRFNRAYLLLLLGSFADGWREYEWRRKQKGWSQGRFPGAEWRGEEIGGKQLFVYAEQGLGDCLMFARFVRSISERGAKVLLGAPARMHAVLERLDGVTAVIPAGASLPQFDLHIPLMSVPRLIDFTPNSVPANVPYLSSDPARTGHWAARLPTNRFRVGIAWHGTDVERAIPLEAFSPLARVPGTALISLQKGAGSEQLDARAELGLVTLGADFDSGPDAFLDTAAVMMNLDLIVTADTAVAHLAGALGRPVWIALRPVPDWRWLLERDDSPWYPTARLFRQHTEGDWQEVFARMSVELAAMTVRGAN